ncbi:MAG: ArnT family glycosyltransferase, partial [Methylobacter sp.]
MNIQKMTPSTVILIASAIYFFTSPHDGNFWWSDAPRHALDGIFYADFFKALPITDPKQYSFDYYSRYPALTILFYPPLFAVIEAAFFTVFGHTHAVAQLTVTFFVFILGLGAYHLAKRYLPTPQALAVALIFLGSNEIAFWGRQVMLDIPAYAFLIWAAIAYLKYTDTQRNFFLYLGTAVFAMGIYTKLNIAFMAPVFFAAITLKLGKKVLNKHIFISVILFTISMLPWLFVTLKFGKVNIGAVAGGQVDDELSRTSIENWIYYANLMPDQIGIIPTVLCSMYFLFFIIRKDWRSNKIDTFFNISWLVFGYIVFSLITLKESR